MAKVTKASLVCESNVSHGPLAAAIIQRQLAQLGYSNTVLISSVGAYAGATPRPVDRRIRDLARASGLNLEEFRSIQLTRELAIDSDYLVCLTEDVFWFVKDLLAQSSGQRISLISEFSGNLALRSIPDPVLGQCSLDQIYPLLENVSEAFVKWLIKRIPS